MSKIIRVGLAFEFDPEGEHDFIFEGMDFDEIVKDATRMAIEDIYRAVDSGDVARQVFVEITESGD